MLCLLFFLLPLLSFSQANYKKAWVVTSQGDSLQGYIDYREWDKNPSQFDFKENPAAPLSRQLTAQTARYVAIAGYEVYEAHRVSISQDEVASGKLLDRIDTTTIRQTVFLKLLQQGNRVKLYAYKDQLKGRFYFLEKGKSTPEELQYRVYLEKGSIATIPLYRHQLAALAVRQQVYTLNQQIQAAAYASAHLLKIASGINGTTAKSLSRTLDKAPKTRWSVHGGLSATTFTYLGENELMIDHISNNGFYQFKNKITTHSLLPSFSAAAHLYLNPAVQRVVLRAELMLIPAQSQVKTHFRYANYSDSKPADEQLNVYNLSMLTLSAAPQLIFNAYNTETLKWYLGAGSAINYRLAFQNKVHLKRTNREVILSETEKNDFFEMRKLGLTLLIRSGITLNKKMDFSVVYGPSARINYKPVDSRHGSSLRAGLLQLSGGYFFN